MGIGELILMLCVLAGIISLWDGWYPNREKEEQKEVGVNCLTDVRYNKDKSKVFVVTLLYGQSRKNRSWSMSFLQFMDLQKHTEWHEPVRGVGFEAIHPDDEPRLTYIQSVMSQKIIERWLELTFESDAEEANKYREDFGFRIPGKTEKEGDNVC